MQNAIVSDKSSFSLIEVLVFVTIVSILFVVAVSTTIASLKNMKYNEHKIIATHLATELQEWLRLQKEDNWGGNLCNGCNIDSNSSFTENASRLGNPQNYCFNEKTIVGWGDSGTCLLNHSSKINTLFDRDVEFNSTVVDGIVQQVNVAITVSWTELGKQYSVKENTVFTPLETPACEAINQSCSQDSDCCSGNCSSNICQ